MLSDVRVVLEGRGLLEGPRLAGDGSAWFADVTGGGVFRLDVAGTVDVVVPKRRGIGGLVLHEDGGVVVTGRTLLHRTARGEDRVLLERDDVTGFNDLTTLPDGTLLVGALRYRPMAGEAPVPGLVLHVEAPGVARVVSESLLWPNGIAVEGDHAFVADFAVGHVMRVALDGSGERVEYVAPRGSCDGLALDAEGKLWVALGHGGGVAYGDEVFDLPAEFVSSLAFLGDEVLITTVGSLLRARSRVGGASVALARV